MTNLSIILDTVKKLSLARGISGYEISMGISSTIAKLIIQNGFKPKIDRFGNVIVTCGKGKIKVLVEAHLDEVGICLTNSLDNNLFQFITIGGTDPKKLLNQKAELLINDCWTEGLFTPLKTKPTSLTDYAISIDKSQTENLMGKVGTFKKYFRVKNDIISGVALDNRVGCTALLDVMRNFIIPNNITLTYAFTVQEEQGQGFGAYKIAKELKPKYALAIDSSYARPYPNSQNWGVPLLGGGPALQVIGTGFVTQGEIVQKVIKIAQKNNINLQLEIPDRSEGATNFKSIQLANPNSKIIGINIPVRNQDTPKTESSLKDILLAGKLIRLVLQQLPKTE